jgi:hypothetical protein
MEDKFNSLFDQPVFGWLFSFVMSKSDDIYKQLQASLQQLQSTPQWHPGANPAQEALTSNALAGNDWLQKGDYSQLPKGQFFNFQMPQQQMDQYKRLFASRFTLFCVRPPTTGVIGQC